MEKGSGRMMQSLEENKAVEATQMRRADTVPGISSQPRRRRSLLRRSSTLSVKKFSPLVSTEEYNSTFLEEFHGPYAHLRKQLDYDYHSHYRKERQWLQDSIIEEMLDNVHDSSLCVTPTEPWLVFTVGPRGAGKKHVVRELVNERTLPLLSFVSVDPDEIGRRLPEFNSYSKKSPSSVDELTRKESGIIAEILTLAALQAGRNVIVDGIMKDAKWHLQLIEKLRKEYPVLKMAILVVSAPAQMVFKRAQKKAMETRREIESETTILEMKGIPISMEVLRPAVDFYCQITNGLENRQVIGDNCLDWNGFQIRFLQTCAWKPGMNGKRKMSFKLSREESRMAIQSTVQMPRLRREFSVLISSEENNRSDDMDFHGKYSHLRKTLDYTFHVNYTLERQHLQDAIISDMLDEAIILGVDGNIGTVPTKPWIIFTAGAMGAGKSHTMKALVEKGCFPLRAFVSVDPDEIRRLLPEFHIYIDENPELAGELTHKEAGYIAEILTLAALQAGKNVLLDGSLRDSDWYKIYFQRLRKEFPSVRQAIIHVNAPREAVFQRAAERAFATGRIVPLSTLEAALEQVPRSVEILAPLVDYYAEINNAKEIELIKPEGSSWDDFERQWHQTVAYLPNRRKILEKAKKVCTDKVTVKGGNAILCTRIGSSRSTTV